MRRKHVMLYVDTLMMHNIPSVCEHCRSYSPNKAIILLWHTNAYLGGEGGTVKRHAACKYVLSLDIDIKIARLLHARLLIVYLCLVYFLYISCELIWYVQYAKIVIPGIRTLTVRSISFNVVFQLYKQGRRGIIADCRVGNVPAGRASPRLDFFHK